MPSRVVSTSTPGNKLTRRRMSEVRSHQAGRNSISQYGHRKSIIQKSVVLDLEMNAVAAQGQMGRITYDHDKDGDYDEIDRLKELELIKQMPIPMARKRRLRAKLDEYTQPPSMRGIERWCYNQRVACYICKRRGIMGIRELWQYLELWSGSFRIIEATFGSGVVTYFRFMKWLFQLNLAIFLLVLLFIMIPQLAFPSNATDFVVQGTSQNLTDDVALAANCSALYVVSVSSDALQCVLDFLQGTGWMEQTLMFYGYYSEGKLLLHSSVADTFNYSMPLAYLSTIIAMLFLSLIIMVHNTATGFSEKLFNNEEAFKQYCNKILGGWDYSLSDSRSVSIKHKSNLRELNSNLAEERNQLRKKEMLLKEKCKLWSLRFCVNLVIIALLAAGAYLIYLTTVTTVELTSSASFMDLQVLLRFLIEYMTSLTITLLNGIIPVVFKFLTRVEKYNAATEVNLILIRTVFLRLASLAVLLATLYTKVTCGPKDYCSVPTGSSCTSIRCWETLVGQEIYKLVIMDFIVAFVVTFFLEMPRKLFVSKSNSKLAKMVGLQQFDIPKNVLQLIYSESLVWIGTLFCPMIPLICVVKNILVFYMKKLSVLVCCQPCMRPYRASDSQQFFMVVLLSTYTLCVVPVIYVIFWMLPSRSCGPFRLYEHMVSIVSTTAETWPSWLQDALSFLTSAAVVIPLIVALCLAIYYMARVIGAYKEKGKLLKEQLTLEGKDKQYLLKRIQELTGETNIPSFSRRKQANGTLLEKPSPSSSPAPSSPGTGARISSPHY